MTLLETTNSYKIINDYFIQLFTKNVNRCKPIRRINISLNNVVDEIYQTHSLFEDEEQNKKEKQLQEAILSIKKKYGKSSIIKGMNLEEKATTLSRNKLIGGHNEE